MFGKSASSFVEEFNSDSLIVNCPLIPIQLSFMLSLTSQFFGKEHMQLSIFIVFCLFWNNLVLILLSVLLLPQIITKDN